MLFAEVSFLDRLRLRIGLAATLLAALGCAAASSGYASAKSALQSRVEALIVKLGNTPARPEQK